MPASTNATMPICIQIQVGDMAASVSAAARGRLAAPRAVRAYPLGSLTTVTKNSSICRTTSMKRSKSTGLVTYAFACRR